MNKYIKWIGVILSVYCMPLSAQIDPKKVHQSVAYIEVKSPSGTSMASGFLWQDNKTVITALHAMNPNAEKITITCGGVVSSAAVEKVYKNADLVLLKTKDPLDLCVPLNRVNTAEPAFHADLFAFGFRPGVSGANTLALKLGAPTSPLLRFNIPETVRAPLMKLGLPSLDLSIYLVNGGLYKGYSGGPVMNDRGDLIGIVSGGLDKGMTNHNWLVPVSNIELLMASRSKEIPANLSVTNHLFSAVLAEPKILQQKNPDTAQVDQPAEQSMSEYRWIKTKTRTFDQLLETADPILGLAELYLSIVPSQMTSAEEALAFDIYEEESLGLVIAIPKGKELFLDEEGSGFIISSVSDRGQADVEIKYNLYEVFDAAGRVVSPSHNDYFTYALNGLLANADCNTQEISCILDRDQFRVVDFGQGNKIARAAFIATGYFDEETGKELTNYFYLSFVVKGDDAMVVDTIMNFDEDSPMMACFMEDSADSCGASFWEPASFMLANAVTTFSDFVIGSDDPVELYDFVYTCDNAYCIDDTEQSSVDQDSFQPSFDQQDESEADFANDQPSFDISYINEQGIGKFELLRDGTWLVNIDGMMYQALEQGVEMWGDNQEYYILTSGDYSFAVPVTDGMFYEGISGEWLVGGAVYLDAME